jgi:hypothetical protein
MPFKTEAEMLMLNSSRTVSHRLFHLQCQARPPGLEGALQPRKRATVTVTVTKEAILL